MAKQARAIEWLDRTALAVSASPAATAVTEASAGIESPARALHGRLVDAFATQPEPAGAKLSARARLLILGVAAILPWLAIAVVGMALIN